jgi:GNAT superfamily N-acetyltransferase
MTAALQEALDATWPSAQYQRLGPFTLRMGQGGGKRVSAASLNSPEFTQNEINAACRAMKAMGQSALFAIWPDSAGHNALDTALAAQGFDLVDPCAGFLAPIDAMLAKNYDISGTYTLWPPLAICDEIWQNAGITAPRRAVMGRAGGAKTAIMVRSGDAVAGVCFVAMGSGATAMVHAIDIAPPFRRQGSAQKLLGRAAVWAKAQGAVNLGLVVTLANTPACKLYAKLGMQEWGRYHYRLQQE